MIDSVEENNNKTHLTATESKIESLMFKTRLFSTASRAAKDTFFPKHLFKGASLVCGGTLFAGAVAYNSYNFQSVAGQLSNDSQIGHLNPDDSVTVDKGLKPFPVKLTASGYPVDSPYSLLTYGVRAVTFLKFNVYGLGIYVSDQDLIKIPKVFNSAFLSKYMIDQDPNKTHKQNLTVALKDPKTSLNLISDLLDSEIAMIVKITPIRNTDFNHLKDGLSKSTMSHPDAKTHSEEMSKGIDEFKNAFTVKGSVPKNDDLFIKKNRDNTLELFHQKKTGEIKKLGVCNNPLVGKCLFAKYLSVPKPLSPSAQEMFVEKVVELV